jgi:predicted chitinase
VGLSSGLLLVNMKSMISRREVNMSKHKKVPIKSAKPKVDNSFRATVSLTCACHRGITLAEIGRTFNSQTKERLENFISSLNAAFDAYAINTCLRKAHFLAQVGHETGQLRLLAEQLGKGVEEKDVYDGYKGRGLIQITYKEGYESYGGHVGQDFTGGNRAKLEEVKWATDSAGWYWSIKSKPSLSGFADKNDLIYISQCINGAFNGYDDRRNLLKRAAAALLVDSCPNRSDCLNFAQYYFSHSAANDVPAAAFGWGLWHDSKSSKTGTVKDDDEALIGYQRFLEIKSRQKRGRFGFKKPKNMIEHAEKRVQALLDEKG